MPTTATTQLKKALTYAIDKILPEFETVEASITPTTTAAELTAQFEAKAQSVIESEPFGVFIWAIPEVHNTVDALISAATAPLLPLLQNQITKDVVGFVTEHPINGTGA